MKSIILFFCLTNHLIVLINGGNSHYNSREYNYNYNNEGMSYGNMGPEPEPIAEVMEEAPCTWGECKEWEIVTFLALSTRTTRDQYEQMQQFLKDTSFSCEHPKLFTYLYTWFLPNFELKYVYCRNKSECVRLIDEELTYEKMVLQRNMTEETMRQIMLYEDYESAMEQQYHILLGRYPSSVYNGALLMFTDLRVNHNEYANFIIFADKIDRPFNLIEIGDFKDKYIPDQARKNADDSVQNSNTYRVANFSDLATLKTTLTPCLQEDTHLSYSQLEDSKNKGPIKLPVIVVGILLLVLTIVFVCSFYCWKKIISTKRRQKISNLLKSVAASQNHYSEPPSTNDNGQPSDEWELALDRFNIDYSQKLGSGAFATVYKGQLKGNSPVSLIYPNNLSVRELRDCNIAVKMLPHHADGVAKCEFMAEIDFMKTLGYHTHLVSLLACATNHQPICLAVEFCEHGDLLKLVRKHKEEILNGDDSSFLKLPDLLSFAWQITDGMTYLANMGCVHRDLAARNILIDASKTAKVGDFGLCRVLDQNLYTTRGGRLPIKWMAIESLMHYEYTTKSDVWSFGVLLFELYSLGEVPFAWLQPADVADHLKAGRRLQRPTLSTDKLYSIMTSCWLEEPNERPDFDSLQQTIAEELQKNSELYGYLLAPTDQDGVNEEVEQEQVQC